MSEDWYLRKRESKQRCGNCIWHIHNGTDWICSCEDSEAYGLETEYTDTCEEYHTINNLHF